jgi:hypothetical protein
VSEVFDREATAIAPRLARFVLPQGSGVPRPTSVATPALPGLTPSTAYGATAPLVARNDRKSRSYGCGKATKCELGPGVGDAVTRRRVCFSTAPGNGAVIAIRSGKWESNPKAQRYANPKRTLAFPAYRYPTHTTRPLTLVHRNTLESPCLPCALVTMWSRTRSGLGWGEREGTGVRPFSLCDRS